MWSRFGAFEWTMVAVAAVVIGFNLQSALTRVRCR